MLVEKWLTKAGQEEKKHRWQSAAGYYQKVLAKEPQNVLAVDGLGKLLLRAKHLDKAAALYAPVFQLGKLDNDQQCVYASVLVEQNRLQLAADVYQNVLGNNESHEGAWLGLGEVLARAGDHERAAHAFRKLLALDKGNDYHGALLARELINSHQYGIARAVVNRLVERMPDSLSMKFAYSEVLAKMGQDRLAINVLKSIDLNESNFVTILVRLVHSYTHVADSEGVESALQQLGDAILTLPVAEQHQLELLRCKNLLQQGRRSEAKVALFSLMERDRTLPGPWYQIAESMPDEIDDALLVELRELVAGASDPLVKSFFYFSLAMVLEKRGNKKQEVAAYEAANALAHSSKPYDGSVARANVGACISAYGDAWFSKNWIGDEEFRPVFILGMPRSGTTLLEQVLGAHGQVETAGESTAMECAVNERMEALGEGNREVYFQTHLNREEFCTLARAFRRLICEIAESDSPFIVEKGMNNPQDAGLLGAMFPNARFVYISRHPVDIAWGCFKQYFATQNFSFSYEGIANQFACFTQLIEHWRNTLPQGLYELRYEDLVSDMPKTVAGLLQYIGLPWDDACLSFDQRQKSVATASMSQIRKGLYTSSVGRWQRYGDLFAPMIAELEGAGIDLAYGE